MTQIIKRKDIDSILEFFSLIGIEYQIENGVKGSFAENIEIKNGVVHFDYEKVLVVDLLHESGHLALVLKEYRHLFSGNLYRGLKKYSQIIDTLDLSDPRMSILMYCDDVQVTAWAWAVGIKLGLAPEDIITKESYGGTGEDIRSILSLSEKSSMPYCGVSGLHCAGYTNKFNFMIAQRSPETTFYPKMNYWTVDQLLMSKKLSTKISAESIA